ncbi:hypothetical protein [Caenispirillum salinarum]|uniref:hypothetical protein n=1 Tax=Caenispirillum salinarum TaxID=859058 RepID=UPI00384E9F3D
MTAAPQPRLQGLRERAVLLVILGFVLLLPPFLLVVDHRVEAFGAPLFYVYIFVVWGGLIGFNAVLARRLDNATRAAEAAEAAASLAGRAPSGTGRAGAGEAAGPGPDDDLPAGGGAR